MLPRDPCSIASLASLLAGSAWCDDTARWQPGVRGAGTIAYAVDWTDEKVWDKWIFSLGWWWLAGERRFGIDAGLALWDMPEGNRDT